MSKHGQFSLIPEASHRWAPSSRAVLCGPACPVNQCVRASRLLMHAHGWRSALSRRDCSLRKKTKPFDERGAFTPLPIESRCDLGAGERDAARRNCETVQTKPISAELASH